jgi:hypothetical protein
MFTGGLEMITLHEALGPHMANIVNAYTFYVHLVVLCFLLLVLLTCF